MFSLLALAACIPIIWTTVNKCAKFEVQSLARDKMLMLDDKFGSFIITQHLRGRVEKCAIS